MTLESKRGRSAGASGEQLSWRECLPALRFIPPFIKLVWQTHRGLTSAMIWLRLLRSLLPLAILWTGKLIIDAVVSAQTTGAFDSTALWSLVALEIALVLTSEILSRLSVLVESLLSDLFSNHTSLRLMRHAATLDLAQFEDPAFYDRLDRARRQTTGRIGLLAHLLALGQDALTLCSLGAALFLYSPYLLLLLLFASLPAFLGETHFASLEYSLLYRWTPQRRELDYLRYLGASNHTAKEVQMFGLANWLTERYKFLGEKFYEENRKLSVRKGVVSILLSIVATLAYYLAFAAIIVRAVEGAITLGSLTLLIATFARSRDGVQRLMTGASNIIGQSPYLKDLFDFFDIEPTVKSPPNALKVPNPLREGFVFDDVGFRYGTSEQWAVRHVSFRLRPGERIAFVGENGAGKTTLTKLLARLYDPTEGRILLDGRDLREYDLDSLRRSIGVIFQDFVRYDLRFDENIGVGEIERVKHQLDSTDDETNTHAQTKSNGDAHDLRVAPSIKEAAEKSMADSLAARLPKGYKQMLGRRFKHGVDLSFGEWQKIALARAYLREAQVLVLDEPTASLDARAEYEVFKRFSHLVQGRMAVIISHRFSTVRMADRIIVLERGQIAEEGTHEELISKRGL